MKRPTQLALGVGLPLLILGTLTLIALDDVGATAIDRALERFRDRYQADIRVSHVDARNPLRVVLRKLMFRRGATRLTAERVRIELDPWSVLKGSPRPRRAIVEGGAGTVVAQGHRARLSKLLLVAEAGDGWSLRATGTIAVSAGEPVGFSAHGQTPQALDVVFDTPLLLPSPGLLDGLQVRASALVVKQDPLHVELSGLRFDGLAAGVEVAARRAQINETEEGRVLNLLGLEVKATLDSLRSLYERVATAHSAAAENGEQRPAAGRPAFRLVAKDAHFELEHNDYQVSVVGATVELDGLRQLRAAGGVTQLGAHAHVALDIVRLPDAVGAEITIQGDGLSVDHPSIATRALTDMRGSIKATVRWAAATETLDISAPELSFNGARARLDASIQGLGAAAQPKLRAHFEIPNQPCAALIDAVPQQAWTVLDGIRVDGDVSGQIDFYVDLAAIEQTIELIGHGDPTTCRALGLGSVRVDQLNDETYVHAWPRQGPGRGPINVGPGHSSWVDKSDIPAHVMRSMIVTEDGRFWRHPGINLNLVRRALKIDLTKGRYVYGGSTISQQLVKNLFLTREKTLARKLEELLITLQMERELEKDRILELYVNVVEFGPDIWGIRRAARYYFDKHPSKLTPLEGAFLATIKPMPSVGPKLARAPRIRGWWRTRLIDIMRWLEEGGYISQIERVEAFPYDLSFSGPVLRRRGDKATTARL